MVAQSTLRTCVRKKVFLKMDYDTAADVYECLAQIRLSYWLHMGASLSELPYSICNIYIFSPLQLKILKKELDWISNSVLAFARYPANRIAGSQPSTRAGYPPPPPADLPGNTAEHNLLPGLTGSRPEQENGLFISVYRDQINAWFNLTLIKLGGGILCLSTEKLVHVFSP